MRHDIVNEIQFENLVKAVKSCFKENYCALYFEDLVNKFGPEIKESELKDVIKFLYNGGKINFDGNLMRLIIK